jgi:hypothetical protein
VTLSAGQTFFLFLCVLSFNWMFIVERPVTFAATAQLNIRPFDFLRIQVVKKGFVSGNAAVDYWWLFPDPGQIKEKSKNNQDGDPKDVSFHQAANVTKPLM